MAKRAAMTAAQRVAKQASDRAYRARKVAEAQAAGLPKSVAYGHAKRAGLPPVSQLRQAGTLPAGRVARPPRTRLTVNGPNGSKVHRTGSKAIAERLLRQAAKAGGTISFRGSFQTSKGYRHATLDGGTNSQQDFLDGGGGSAYGGVGRLDTPTSRGGTLSGSGVVEIRTGAGGANAADVWEAWLYYADFFDDFWDFLAAWAEADYS